MQLVEINKIRDQIEQQIDDQAERDAKAIRKAGFYRIKPNVRRGETRIRPRAA